MTRRPDLTGLLETLDRHGVAFIVTGSVGAMAHGATDVDPADLDVVPATDEPNLRRLSTTLAELRAVPAPVQGAWETDEHGAHRWVEDGIPRQARPLDPGDPNSFDHRFDTALGTLDVVPRIAGPYGQLRSRAVRMEIGGHPAWVAHPTDLLAGMTVPRREKDRARVAHLRRVAADSG